MGLVYMWIPTVFEHFERKKSFGKGRWKTLYLGVQDTATFPKPTNRWYEQSFLSAMWNILATSLIFFFFKLSVHQVSRFPPVTVSRILSHASAGGDLSIKEAFNHIYRRQIKQSAVLSEHLLCNASTQFGIKKTIIEKKTSSLFLDSNN